jgi:hypothetical protein
VLGETRPYKEIGINMFGIVLRPVEICSDSPESLSLPSPVEICAVETVKF